MPDIRSLLLQLNMAVSIDDEQVELFEQFKYLNVTKKITT